MSAVPKLAAAPDALAVAIAEVADGLTAADFDVRSPAWEGSAYLKISNTWGELCDLTITEYGAVTWEWRSCAASAADPGRVTAIALELLGAGQPDVRVERGLDRPLKTLVGRALTGCGLEVEVKVLGAEEDYFEVYAGIEAKNPTAPLRGTVRVADDSAMWWDCRTVPLAEGDGLELGEVTATIARALAAGRA